MSVTSRISGAVRHALERRRHRRCQEKLSTLISELRLLRLEQLVALMAATSLTARL